MVIVRRTYNKHKVRGWAEAVGVRAAETLPEKLNIRERSAFTNDIIMYRSHLRSQRIPIQRNQTLFSLKTINFIEFSRI